MNTTTQHNSELHGKIAHNNRVLVTLLPGLFGLTGVLATIALSVSSIFVLALYFLGKVPTNSSQIVRKAAACFLFYFLLMMVLAVIHFDLEASVRALAMNAPFLAFLPLASAFVLTPPDQLRFSLETGAAIGSLLIGLFVIYELSYLHVRAWAGAGNPGPFAVIMCVNYSICMFALMGSPFKRPLLYSAGAAAAAFCILASGMRTLLPMILITPAIAGMCLLDFSRLSTRQKLLGLTGALILAAIVTLNPIVADRFNEIWKDLETIRETSNYKTSIGVRLIMWEYAINNISNSPWTGFGELQSVKNFSEHAMEVYNLDIKKTHYHNMFLTALMRGGVINILALTVLLFGPLIVAWRTRNSENWRYAFGLIACVTVTYLLSGLLNIAFGHDLMDFLYVFMMAYCFTMLGETAHSEEIRS